MGARVMMLASGKGGTGKSAVAVFLATQLAKRGKRVLLVELSEGCRSIDIMAGVAAKTVYDIGDMLTGQCSVSKALLESPLEKRLFIANAPYAKQVITVKAMQAFLKIASRIFDEILLDTSGGLGAMFDIASRVSDTGLIVITPDMLAMRAGQIVCDKLYENGVQEVRLVINQVPKTLQECGIEDFDVCIDTVGARLLGVIPYHEEIIQAIHSGTGLPDEKSLISHIFSALAARLCGQEVPLQFYEVY